MKPRDRPRLDSGLPPPLERQLIRRYGRTPAGRMKLAAALKALAVLVRRHPRAMLDMVGSGAVQAARVGVQEVSARVGRYERDEAAAARPPARRPLTRREWRRFRKALDRAGS